MECLIVTFAPCFSFLAGVELGVWNVSTVLVSRVGTETSFIKAVTVQSKKSVSPNILVMASYVSLRPFEAYSLYGNCVKLFFYQLRVLSTMFDMPVT